MDMGLREMCWKADCDHSAPPGLRGWRGWVCNSSKGVWDMVIVCILYFWGSNTICFFHLKPQPRKSVVFIQVFGIFVSKPCEFDVSAMLMGLSRSFWKKQKKQKTLDSSNPCVEMSLKGVPRWARCFLGKLFPGTVECWTYKLSKKISLWKRLVSSSGNTSGMLLSRLLWFDSDFGKMNPPHGVWWNPFFSVLVLLLSGDGVDGKCLIYRSNRHFGLIFFKIFK